MQTNASLIQKVLESLIGKKNFPSPSIKGAFFSHPQPTMTIEAEKKEGEKEAGTQNNWKVALHQFNTEATNLRIYKEGKKGRKETSHTFLFHAGT